ncbi:MAG TPA: T9SS type A sorting domain-containing protein [Candidatus Eisenbacteria bacterium]|nr:T9SS type A sorting domain-containing protein [Candidatus Eisenbacteria bacterium]
MRIRAAVGIVIGIGLAAPAAHGSVAGLPARRELQRLHQEIVTGELAGLAAERDEALARARRRGVAEVLARMHAALTGAHDTGGRLEFPLRREPPLPIPTTLGVFPPPVAPPNVRLNDPRADLLLGSAQSETAIALHGATAVAAWNDGEGQRTGPNMMGWGFSIDGGATWTEGGLVPLADSVAAWVSDPVLTVNERTGTFYLAGLVITSTARNGVAVMAGHATPGGFAWQPPVVAFSVRDTLPDKPWIAADSSADRVQLVYTLFVRKDGHGSDLVAHQLSADGGVTWSPPEPISNGSDEGLVQGARCAVGPAGELWTAWTAVDTSLASDGSDYLRAREARDGVHFQPEQTVAHVFSNFGSGGPGYNRGYGFAWPSLAVDRSRGPARGRVYLAWNESVDFYADSLGGAGVVGEREPDTAPTTATPFTVGRTLEGTLSSRDDVDWFRFGGTQGQTAVFFADSVADSLDLSFRVVCSDGATRLAFDDPGGTKKRFIAFTLPWSGYYYLRFAANSQQGGAYRVRSGWHAGGGERGRDERDVFATWSDDGAGWADPVRINDDPAWFDDWLPEIAVSPDGTVWATWYDWRDAPASACGGVSNIYLAHSLDGGRTWSAAAPASDAPTPWSLVTSNLAPNQGDYIALTTDTHAVVPCWADGRDGDPDAYAAWVAAPMRIELARADAEDGRVSLVWRAPAAAGTIATLERQVAGGAWDSLAVLATGAGAELAYDDDSVRAGVRYGYRLALADDAGPRTAGEVTLEVPLPLPLAPAIERVWPNPTPGVATVRFALPDDRPATLALLDLAGRRVARRVVRGAGWHDETLAPAVRAGLYFVRIEQAGRAVTARLSILK